VVAPEARGKGQWLMTLDDAAQAALEKVLYAQALHVRDAHSGELPQSCRTCVALSDAVAACRIAAVEGPDRPEKTAHGRMRTRKK
jgi:hypothetical protein